MPAPDSVVIMTLAYAQGRIWRPPAHDVSCMCVRDVLMALAQALRCPWSPPPKWSALPTVTAAASPPTSRSNMRGRSSRRRSDRRPPRPSRTDPGSCACRRCTGRRAGGYPQWQRKAVIAQAPPQQRPAFVLAKDVLREAFAPQPMNLQIRAQAASVRPPQEVPYQAACSCSQVDPGIDARGRGPRCWVDMTTGPPRGAPVAPSSGSPRRCR